MVRGLRHVWYGDDFTGASDTLATLARAGLRSILFLGIPSRDRVAAVGPLDALGIAGAARSMNPKAMEAALAPVGEFLVSLGAPVLHYKCCSTFDSSPTVGSLGVALRIFKRHVRNEFVAIVGGQPSLARYCAFGTLFARMGGDGEAFRIDRHPTMSRHPVTPMQEADLRRHLALQGLQNVSLVDLIALSESDEALETTIDAAFACNPAAVLFDVTDSMHLARIGRVLWRRALHSPLLVLGASSVAEALIAHWHSNGDLSDTKTAEALLPATGPVFVLAGSQSPVSAHQVEAARLARDGTAPLFECVAVDAAAIVGDPAALEAVARSCADALKRSRAVVAHTGPVRHDGPVAHDVAAACGRLLARVLVLAPDVRRVGVAGGDSSSLAVQALGGWALSHESSLSPGVSLTRLHSDTPRLNGLELMLKGGQMGLPDVFERLVRGER